MPIYEYKCSEAGCGKLDVVISQKADGGPKEIECKACGGRSFKILSPCNFIIEQPVDMTRQPDEY